MQEISKRQILTYLRSLKAEDHGFYFQAGHNQRTLMGSAFAILTLELINELGSLDQNAERDVFLNAQEPESGLFIDPLRKGQIADIHDLEQNYLHYQTSAFSISVLDAFGSKPQHPFKFLDPFRDQTYINSWLESLDWSKPWHISNKVMFILQFLSYEDIVLKKSDSHNLLLKILERLKEYQDPCTGLWGTQQNASSHNAMAGTFHFLSFYQFYEIDIPHQDEMHKSTLSLQASDGLFHPFGGGGACEDLDALYILNTTVPGLEKDKSFKTQMAQSYNSLLNSQNRDGGFCWSKRPKYDLSLSIPFLVPWSPTFNFDIAKWILKRRFLSIIFPKLKDPDTYLYSNWDMMKYDVEKSDTWSTWFRLLALAAIERSYPGFCDHDIQFNYRSIPSLGWMAD